MWVIISECDVKECDETELGIAEHGNQPTAISAIDRTKQCDGSFATFDIQVHEFFKSKTAVSWAFRVILTLPFLHPMFFPVHALITRYEFSLR
jgi:hypothetical protein